MNKITCEECGKEAIDKSKNKRKRFCSDNCRAINYYKRNTKKRNEKNKKWRDKNPERHWKIVVLSQVKWALRKNIVTAEDVIKKVRETEWDKNEQKRVQ